MTKGKLKQNRLSIWKKIILAVLPGLLVVSLVWSADTYYNLDTTKIVSNQVSRFLQAVEMVAGLSVTGGLTVDTATTTADLTVQGSAYLGSMEFVEDSGQISWINMPVSATPTAGTIESYTAQIDSTNILTVYSEADGTGGIQYPRVGIGTTTPAHTLDVVGDLRVTATTTLATTTIHGLLTVDGNILPATTTTYTLGSQTYKWANIYTATATIGDTIVINTDSVSATSSLNITANAASLWQITDNLTISATGTFTATSTDTLTLGSATGEVTLATGSAQIVSEGTDAAILINPNGTGAVQFHATTNYIDSNGSLVLDGNITLTAGGTFYTTDNGDLVFAPNGSGNLVIGESDNPTKIIPATTTTSGFDLGSVAYRWYDAYLSNNLDIASTTLSSTTLSFIGAGTIQTAANQNLTLQISGTGNKIILTNGTSTIQLATSTKVVLGDSAGVNEFQIYDSSDSKVAWVDSNGNTVATGTLVVAATTTLAINEGFVGIATTTPASTLGVYGTSTFMGGRVGIATTSPSEALTVIGNIWGSGNIVVADTNATSTFYGALEVYGTTTFGQATSSPTIFTGYVQSDIIPYSNVAYDLGTSTLKWRNLYVATTTIGNTIVIGGDSISATGTLALTTGDALNITAGAASTWQINDNLTISATGTFTATSTDDMIFVTGGTEKMRIEGTTSRIGIATSSPRYTVDIYGSLAVGTGTTPTLYVASTTGRVGIATSSPTQALSVAGNIYGSGNIVIQDTIDTGEGATEVFAMNQDVRTEDDVTFANLIVSTTATTTQLFVTSTSTLGTVTSGTWQGTAIADEYVADDIALTNITQITSRDLGDMQGTLALASTTGILVTTQGGTGQDTSDWTGFPYITGGDWGTSTVVTSESDPLWTASGTEAELENILGIAFGTEKTATSGYFLVGDGTDFESQSASSTRTTLEINNVENIAISTWAGSSNILTVGTIGSGIWQGTAIADAYIASSTEYLADTTLSEEEVEDYVGTMLGGTETLITVDYIDGAEGAGNINFIVNNDLSQYSNATSGFLTTVAYGDLTGYPADVITAGTLLSWSASTTLNATVTKSDVDLGNVENTALSTWGGSTNILTVGTIATGTWEGDAIADDYVADEITLTNITQITNRAITDTSGTLTVARGGTGATTLTSNGVLLGQGTSAISAVAAPADTYKVLSTLNGTVIAWNTLESSHIPDLAASKITSGTFDTARIPDLAASKITSGNLTIARLPTGGNWDITSDLTVETDTLFIGRVGGSYAGRVGIGTTTPAVKLDVEGKLAMNNFIWDPISTTTELWLFDWEGQPVLAIDATASPIIWQQNLSSEFKQGSFEHTTTTKDKVYLEKNTNGDYYVTGTFITVNHDYQGKVEFLQLVVVTHRPSFTSINAQVQVSDDNFSTIKDSITLELTDDLQFYDIPSLSNARYVRVKFDFQTEDVSITPELIYFEIRANLIETASGDAAISLISNNSFDSVSNQNEELPILEQITSAIKDDLEKLGLFIQNGVAQVRELIADKITTKEIYAEKLCIGDICINRNQLKELIEEGSDSGTSGGAGSSCQSSEEICDGLDNDCDGLIDEDLGQTTCGVGVCQVTVNNCVGGTLQTCTPGIPTEEICDGIDNNCDGQIDESGVCETTVPPAEEPPAEEVCDATHLNLCLTQAECEVAEGFWYNQACNLEPEAPTEPEEPVCDSENLDLCTTQELCQAADLHWYNETCNLEPETPACQPTEEVCDGIDNNCNDLIDEDLTIYSGTDEGVCQQGIMECIDGQMVETQAEIGPTEEICDGMDNDCDGLIDEDLGQQCGLSDVGACQFGTQTCEAGAWGECLGAVEPTDEICGDGIDNNCDGQVDEGCQTQDATSTEDTATSTSDGNS